MRIKKTLVAGTLLAAATVLVPVLAASTASASAVRPADFACYGFGTGATAQAALVAARQDMVGDVTVGGWVYTSGQYADGTYWEQIAADCSYIR